MLFVITYTEVQTGHMISKQTLWLPFQSHVVHEYSKEVIYLQSEIA